MVSRPYVHRSILSGIQAFIPPPLLPAGPQAAPASHLLPHWAHPPPTPTASVRSAHPSPLPSLQQCPPRPLSGPSFGSLFSHGNLFILQAQLPDLSAEEPLSQPLSNRLSSAAPQGLLPEARTRSGPTQSSSTRRCTQQLHVPGRGALSLHLSRPQLSCGRPGNPLWPEP